MVRRDFLIMREEIERAVLRGLTLQERTALARALQVVGGFLNEAERASMRGFRQAASGAVPASARAGRGGERS